MERKDQYFTLVFLLLFARKREGVRRRTQEREKFRIKPNARSRWKVVSTTTPFLSQCDCNFLSAFETDTMCFFFFFFFFCGAER